MGKSRRDLSIEFLMSLFSKQKGRCAVTGVHLTHLRGKGRVSTNVSIDRIDSSVGYLKSNVRLVCSIVNRMKMEHSDSEFLWWSAQVVLHLKPK